MSSSSSSATVSPNNSSINNTNNLVQTSTFYLDDIVDTSLDVTPKTKTHTAQLEDVIREEDDSHLAELKQQQQPISSYDLVMQDFLENARNGNVTRITELIESSRSNTPNSSVLNDSSPLKQQLAQFDINYKGKPKRFYGWTALHICCYFNHIEIVKLLLQHPDCDVNVRNYENDTPLHKACLTSRYEIVELLLTNNADINIRNNEGLKPKDLVTDPTVKKLIQAAETAETHNLQKQFFEAVSNNDIETINKLLKNKNFDLNCTDTFGNTALHLVANRNSCEIAVLLIQKGINTVIKNKNQLTALDLAKSKEMKEILGYVPFNWRKYEGVLLKKRKFLGYKEYYVVLNKGSIIYYQNKKDAAHDTNRKGTYFLNNAIIKEYTHSHGAHTASSSSTGSGTPTSTNDFWAYSWTINYTNGRKHTLCSAIPIKKRAEYALESSDDHSRKNANKRAHLNPAERKKKWIQAINEHIRYSDSNFQQADTLNMLPMESLQQNLNTLKLDEDKLNYLLAQLEQQFASVSLADLNQLPSQSHLHPIISNYKTNFENLKNQIRLLVNDFNKCLNLHEQRNTLLKSQLAEAKHKADLLEQSLRVIAQENHDLEAKKLTIKSTINSSTNISNTNTTTNVNSNNSGANLASSISNTANLNANNNAARLPELVKSSIEADLVNQAENADASDTELEEEFFDIADDPLTEEELDNDNKLSDKETTSLTLRSCYGSINDLNEGIKDALQQSNSNNNDKQQQQQQQQQSQRAESPRTDLVLDQHGWRTRLPAKMFDRSQISIWSILKQFIGKELSKIAMPAALCEPLSFLQRITENVYYSDLLNKAADPSYAACALKRMEYVAAYAITNISSNIDRLSKPFNPLLGETYELVREDLGFRIICEQVSHHPPVSAFHCDSTSPNTNWKFYGTVNPKIKFWGKSIEVTPKGTLTLELTRFNETYTWSAVTCCVHNIIVGKLWFEYYGTMEITCHQTGYKAIINFKPYSWSNKELHKVDGYIYDNKKNKLKALYGYWTHCVYSCDAIEFDNYLKTNKPLPMAQLDDLFNEIKPAHKTNSLLTNRHHAHSEANFDLKANSTSSNGNLHSFDELADETQAKLSINLPTSASSLSLASTATSLSSQLNATELWRVNPRPPYGAEYYMFNYFTMTLNELKPEFEKIIAPTDSRFRTDVRKLELGDLDGASQEKTRLEEKQRESRKNGKEYKGKWFQLGKHPLCNEEAWLFNNKYWLRNYSDCLNLY